MKVRWNRVIDFNRAFIFSIRLVSHDNAIPSWLVFHKQLQDILFTCTKFHWMQKLFPKIILSIQNQIADKCLFYVYFVQNVDTSSNCKFEHFDKIMEIISVSNTHFTSTRFPFRLIQPTWQWIDITGDRILITPIFKYY